MAQFGNWVPPPRALVSVPARCDGPWFVDGVVDRARTSGRTARIINGLYAISGGYGAALYQPAKRLTHAGTGGPLVGYGLTPYSVCQRQGGLV